jgi:hypothetical protein
MSKRLWDRSDEDITEELVQPLKELLAREDEALKKANEMIREAERKAKAALDPEA